MGSPFTTYNLNPDANQPQAGTQDLENQARNTFLTQQTPQPPANNAQNAGPVKTGLRSVLSGLLRNFSYGASQAMLKAAGEETDAEQATRLAATAHLNAQTKLINAQSEMTPVQLPNGGMVYLPATAAAGLMKQLLTNQGKTDVANINKRFLTTPNGLYDTQTKDQNGFPTLIPNSGAGIAITPDIAKQYSIPPEYVGKNMKLTDLAALERGQAFSNAMIQTAAGPLVVPKSGPNMGQATPVTVNGKGIMSNQQAGAYWQAVYGLTPTTDTEGNPQLTPRINAAGMAPAANAFQIFKGKQGLTNYKDALGRIQDNLDVLDDTGQRAILAQTLRSIGTIHDPGIIAATLGNAVSQGLNPKAADLAAAMLQAREFIGANRQFAGNFQGSEALYQRMVANVPGPMNSKELNQALIKQDLANTARIEQGMSRFQGGNRGNQNQSGGKTLDAATAAKFLQQAGGDKDKARGLARQAGYSF